MRVFSFISTLLLICNAYGLQNITVDDTDRSSIVYEGNWSPNTFQMSDLDLGGSHVVSVGDPSATATFTFTGVAVYYMSPLWPFSIGVVIAVDSEDSEFVDLTDYSSSVNSVDSVETIPSQPVWGKSGLTNSMHQVVVSAPQGSDFVVVDGFIYTIPDPDDLSTTSSSSPSSSLLTSPAMMTSGSSASSNPMLTTTPLLEMSSTTASDSPSTSQSNSATSETRLNTDPTFAVPGQTLISTNSPIPLAGGIVGGIALVVGVVLAVLFCAPGPEAHLSDYWP